MQRRTRRQQPWQQRPLGGDRPELQARPSRRGPAGARSRPGPRRGSRPAGSPAGTRPARAFCVNRLTQRRSPRCPWKVPHGIRAAVTSSTTSEPIRQRSPIARRTRRAPSVVRFSPNAPSASVRAQLALPGVEVLAGDRRTPPGRRRRGARCCTPRPRPARCPDALGPGRGHPHGPVDRPLVDAGQALRVGPCTARPSRGPDSRTEASWRHDRRPTSKCRRIIRTAPKLPYARTHDRGPSSPRPARRRRHRLLLRRRAANWAAPSPPSASR